MTIAVDDSLELAPPRQRLTDRADAKVRALGTTRAGRLALVLVFTGLMAGLKMQA